MQWLLLLILFLFLFYHFFLFRFLCSSGRLDSGGSSGSWHWSRSSGGGSLSSSWGSWSWSKWSCALDLFQLLLIVLPVQFASVRGDSDSLSGTDLGVWLIGHTWWLSGSLDSTGTLALLDSLEVVLISVTASPEEVLALIEIGVEVESQLVLVAWSTLLWKSTAGSTAVGLETH